MAKKTKTAKTTTKSPRDVAAEVTASIIAQLESGTAPWNAPWKGDAGVAGVQSLPSNAKSGRAYSGTNVLLLWMAALGAGFADSRWVTFNQARELGGTVKKGERGTQIVFWKFIKKEDADGEERKIGFAKTFTVFNVSQCDGLDLPSISAVSPEPAGTIADRVAAEVGAEVILGGDRACYSPGRDVIFCPVLAAFKSPEGYDSTLLHELAHWTGHASREARAFGKRFGDGAYAMEELVAELSSAFLCARLGITGSGLQHASYVAHWIEILKGDKHAIFTAASAAEKAVARLLPERAELTVGDRVVTVGLSDEDADTGIVHGISGDVADVGWDSGVRTPAPISVLSAA